jgi:hypothetical protein
MVGKAIGGGKAEKPMAVEAVEPVFGADPKKAAMILAESGYDTICQTLVCAVKLKNIMSAGLTGSAGDCGENDGKNSPVNPTTTEP